MRPFSKIELIGWMFAPYASADRTQTLSSDAAHAQIDHAGGRFRPGQFRKISELVGEVIHAPQLRDDVKDVRVVGIDRVLLDLQPIAVEHQPLARNVPDAAQLKRSSIGNTGTWSGGPM